MAWIESHTVLLRHRKTVSSARELRLKPVHFLGHIHALWHAVLEQQEDGDLSSWSDETIAHAADYDGECSKFVSCLHKFGWLDATRTVHDWLDYTGLYLTRKYANRNKPRLAEIWLKHGRVYGETARRVSDNLATGKQQLLAPDLTDLTRPNQPREPPDPPSALPPQDFSELTGPMLAQRFVFRQTCRKEDVYVLGKEIDSMIAFGYDPCAIFDEIEKPKTERDHGEKFFKLKDRLEKVKKKKARVNEDDILLGKT